MNILTKVSVTRRAIALGLPARTSESPTSRVTTMTVNTMVFALLMFAVSGSAQADFTTGTAGSKTPLALAAGNDSEPSRYRDAEASREQGPFSVHVTTFDGSPTTLGTWYERPRRNLHSMTIPDGPTTPRTPFDRNCSPAGCD